MRHAKHGAVEVPRTPAGSRVGTEMIVINRIACSKEFTSVLDAVEVGKDVRRASWPEGMFLRKQNDQIAVIRAGSIIAPAWMGPSTEDSEATDWQIV